MICFNKSESIQLILFLFLPIELPKRDQLTLINFELDNYSIETKTISKDSKIYLLDDDNCQDQGKGGIITKNKIKLIFLDGDWYNPYEQTTLFLRDIGT